MQRRNTNPTKNTLNTNVKDNVVKNIDKTKACFEAVQNDFTAATKLMYNSGDIDFNYIDPISGNSFLPVIKYPNFLSQITAEQNDLNLLNNAKETPINSLIKNDRGYIIINELIKNEKIKIDIKDSDGNSSLDLILNSKLPLDAKIQLAFELHKKQNLDINLQNRDGNTLLHLILINKDLTFENKIEMISKLFERKDLDINIQNNDGNTPLHLLISQTDIVKEWRDFCINMFFGKFKQETIEVQNNAGKTAIDLSKDYNEAYLGSQLKALASKGKSKVRQTQEIGFASTRNLLSTGGYVEVTVPKNSPYTKLYSIQTSPSSASPNYSSGSSSENNSPLSTSPSSPITSPISTSPNSNSPLATSPSKLKHTVPSKPLPLTPKEVEVSKLAGSLEETLVIKSYAEKTDAQPQLTKKISDSILIPSKADIKPSLPVSPRADQFKPVANTSNNIRGRAQTDLSIQKPSSQQPASLAYVDLVDKNHSKFPSSRGVVHNPGNRVSISPLDINKVKGFWSEMAATKPNNPGTKKIG